MRKLYFFRSIDLPLNLLDLILQNSFSFGRGVLRFVLRLKLFQFIFPLRDELARFTGFLRPAVAGKRLKVCRRTIHVGSAVGVGAIGIHVHVALDQERFATGLRVLELQDGVAVEKIVAGNDLIEPG